MSEVKGSAGKAGYCDAIMGRESADTTSMGHYERLNYERGYQAGKESGVIFHAARERNRVTEGGKGWNR